MTCPTNPAKFSHEVPGEASFPSTSRHVFNKSQVKALTNLPKCFDFVIIHYMQHSLSRHTCQMNDSKVPSGDLMQLDVPEYTEAKEPGWTLVPKRLNLSKSSYCVMPRMLPRHAG